MHKTMNKVMTKVIMIREIDKVVLLDKMIQLYLILCPKFNQIVMQTLIICVILILIILEMTSLKIG